MNESKDIRGLQLKLGVYILIFAMKLVVFLMSGVIALLAERMVDLFMHSSNQAAARR